MRACFLLLALVGLQGALGYAPARSGFFAAHKAAACAATPAVTTGASIEMMRHGRKGARLGRAADQRKALLRALTTECLRHGQITTTLSKCKAVRSEVDKMITLAKNGSLHSRRQALSYVYDKQLVHALFEAVPDRYGEREGGYTRITRGDFRRGDNVQMGTIELV